LYRDHVDCNDDTSIPFIESAKGKRYYKMHWSQLVWGVTLADIESGKVKKEHKQSYAKLTGKYASSAKKELLSKTYGEWAVEYVCAFSANNDNDPVVSCTLSSRSVEYRGKSLIDTGAKSNSYISPRAAAALAAGGAAAQTCAATVCGATGACRRCLGTLFVDINITSGKSAIFLPNVRVNIVEMSYDIIIGLPEIRKFDLTKRLRSLFVENGFHERGAIGEDGTEQQPLCAVHIQPEESTSAWTSLVEKRYKEIKSVIIPASDVLGPSAEEEKDDWLPGEECDLLTAISESDASTLYGDALEAWPSDDDVTLPIVEGDTREAAQIRALVKKFEKLFRKTVAKTPCKVPPMKIELDEEKWKEYRRKFASTAYRRQSQAKNDEVLRQIRLMLALGVIVPSSAETYSQVLLAKKPNNKWRFCIDYRALNECIKNVHWPLPNIEEMLERIGAARPRWFALIDLTSGYHQVELDVSCRELCAFITAFGLFMPTRVAFGIKTAPAYFQQQIAGTVMRNLNHSILEMYIDDILIHARTFPEYMTSLETVFQRLADYNITVNPEKCKLGLRDVEFVGHHLQHNGIAIVKTKIQKVLDFVRPDTVKGLQSFLGLVNFFHSHIMSYSDMVKPLFNLLKEAKENKDQIPWTLHYLKYFEGLKEAINRNEKLYFYDASHGIV
jgi:hypothetical protein